MSSFLPACWQAWVGTRGERRGGRLEAGEGGAGSPLGPPSPEAAGGGVGFDPQNITHVGVGSREVGRLRTCVSVREGEARACEKCQGPSQDSNL